MKEGNVVAWSGHATYSNYLCSIRYRCSETLGAYYKVLQGPPRSSKVLQGTPPPRYSKVLQGAPRPWRLSTFSEDLGDYLQYICYLACYLSSVSSLATGSLVLCNAVLGIICD